MSTPGLIFFNGWVAYFTFFIAVIPLVPFMNKYPKRDDFVRAIVFGLKDILVEKDFFKKDNLQRGELTYPYKAEDAVERVNASFMHMALHFLSIVYVFSYSVAIRFVPYRLFSIKCFYYGACAAIIATMSKDLLYIQWFDLFYEKKKQEEEELPLPIEEPIVPVIEEVPPEQPEQLVQEQPQQAEQQPPHPEEPIIQVDQIPEQPVAVARPAQAPVPPPRPRRARNNPRPPRAQNQAAVNRRQVIRVQHYKLPRESYYNARNLQTAQATVVYFGVPILIFVYGGSWICEQIIRYTFNLY